MDADVLSPPALHTAIGVAAQLVFPSLALGLACYLAVLEGLWVATRNEVFRTLYVFWSAIFAIALPLGLLAILTVGGALGWGWTGSALTSVTAALMALLAAMVFGRDRVGAGAHFAASILMAASLTTMLVWATALASPSHTAPSELFAAAARLALGAFIVTALAVGAVTAWRLLREPEEAASAMALRMSVGMLAISAVLRLLIGDLGWRDAASQADAQGWMWPIEAGLGAAVVWLALWAGWLVRRHGGPERSPRFLRSCLAMGAVGSAALLAGWTLGRMGGYGQGHANALAPASAGVVALWVIYAALFGAGGFLILRLAGRPPQDAADGPEAH